MAVYNAWWSIVHQGFIQDFLLEGGNLVRACARIYKVVPTFQVYTNYSFQLVYCALSALSRQATPSYPYMHTEVEVSQTLRKVTQYHKAI